MISSDQNLNDAGAAEAGSITDEDRILLESGCVDLIGEFEQLIETARSEREAGFLGESMVLGKRMLLTLVEFADGYLEEEPQEDVVDRIASGCVLADNGIQLSSSQNFRAFRRVLGKKTASDLEVAEAHGAVGTAVADALTLALGSAVERLGKANISEAIGDSLEPILLELREQW